MSANCITKSFEVLIFRFQNTLSLTGKNKTTFHLWVKRSEYLSKTCKLSYLRKICFVSLRSVNFLCKQNLVIQKKYFYEKPHEKSTIVWPWNYFTANIKFVFCVKSWCKDQYPRRLALPLSSNYKLVRWCIFNLSVIGYII